MHRELCRQKILAINIKIDEHAAQLAVLSPPDAKIILLRSILDDLEKSKGKLNHELEDMERTGEASFSQLLLAYSESRKRFADL